MSTKTRLLPPSFRHGAACCVLNRPAGCLSMSRKWRRRCWPWPGDFTDGAGPLLYRRSTSPRRSGLQRGAASSRPAASTSSISFRSLCRTTLPPASPPRRELHLYDAIDLRLPARRTRPAPDDLQPPAWPNGQAGEGAWLINRSCSSSVPHQQQADMVARMHSLQPLGAGHLFSHRWARSTVLSHSGAQESSRA